MYFLDFCSTPTQKRSATISSEKAKRRILLEELRKNRAGVHSPAGESSDLVMKDHEGPSSPPPDDQYSSADKYQVLMDYCIKYVYPPC